MNELLTKKLNSLLNLDKPKKTIGIWNIRELCNKIQAENLAEQYELKFDFTYLYHYLGLKIVNEYDDKKDVLLEGYELLKVTYYSGQYKGELERIRMLAQLVASGVTCSKIAEVRMLLRDECLDESYVEQFDNPFEKLYVITIIVFLLAVRKLNGWNDIDEIEILKNELDIVAKNLVPEGEEEIYFVTGCFNLEEAIGSYISYIVSGKPANVEKVIIRKIIAARDSFNEIERQEDALLVLLIMHALKAMIRNSLWASIEGISQKLDEYLEMILSRSNSKPIFDLWPSQKNAIEQNLFDMTKSALVVQMPTSAGKSLLAKLYIMQTKSVYSDAKIAYLVPTRALVNQVKRDLKTEFEGFGYSVDIAIPFMDIDEIEEELLLKNTDILVTTPEKFDIMQRSKHPFVDKLRLVIVDEAHNIQDGERGAKLELLLAMLRKSDRNLKILMLSPFMKNANEIASWLSDDRGIDIFVNWKPAQQFTGISRNIPLSPRGSVQQVKYIPSACNDVYSEEFTLDIKRLSRQEKKKAGQSYLLAEKYKHIGGVLVLCTQQRYAENFAEIYLDKDDISEAEKLEISPLLELIETEMGSDSLLYKVLLKGCAYHHSALPLSIREEIEDAIRRGFIKVVAATTTLAQGMNFPIATVIFQGMTVPQGGYSRNMSASEFWNIAGRAGRALVDKEGHVIAVCGSDEQEEQFREYLVNRSEEIVSSLLQVIEEIPEDCLSSYYIEQYGELSTLLQYIYHIEKLYEDIEIEDLLRGSYVYSNLERKGNNELAEKLVRITKKYIGKMGEDLSRKKLMDIIDTTGISSISMKKLMFEISKRNMSIPESAILFSGKDSQLVDVIKMVNSIPEINLGMFDANAPLNAENVALLTKMWVHGYSIRAIADKCINNENYDAQAKMNICGKYIYSKLINNLPWGISAIFKAQGIVNPKEDKGETYPLIPAFIYFGVNNVVSVALCMLGVSRYAARILAKEWYRKQGEISIKQCEKVREWLYSLNLEDWKRIFKSHEAKNAETNYNIWLKNR